MQTFQGDCIGDGGDAFLIKINIILISWHLIIFRMPDYFSTSIDRIDFIVYYVNGITCSSNIIFIPKYADRLKLGIRTPIAI